MMESASVRGATPNILLDTDAAQNKMQNHHWTKRRFL